MDVNPSVLPHGCKTFGQIMLAYVFSLLSLILPLRVRVPLASCVYFNNVFSNDMSFNAAKRWIWAAITFPVLMATLVACSVYYFIQRRNRMAGKFLQILGMFQRIANQH